jgi:hypothetical protein
MLTIPPKCLINREAGLPAYLHYKPVREKSLSYCTMGVPLVLSKKQELKLTEGVLKRLNSWLI